MLLRQIFDPKLAQYAYLIGCQQTGEALLIDPERDIDRYVELADSEGLRITAVTETHIHADFLSGAREFADRFGVALYLSDEGDADWKYEWVQDGDYEVQLLKDGDSFRIGNVEIQALHTPGHTPEHVSFMVLDHGSGASEPMGIATGDFVFVGDLGRPDLLESAAGQVGAMEPSARTLYRSVQDFLELPDYLQLWPAHGAGSACGKALGAVPSSTVGYEKRYNAAIGSARGSEQEFVAAILEGQPEPPLYFARMKRLNKQGPPLLGELPVPARISAESLAGLVGESGAVVIDTRLDRRAFMQGHLPGALYAPLDKSFPTVVGCYVLPEEEIHLIVEEERTEEAVRDLVRIGYDRVVGCAPPETLAEVASIRELGSTPIVDFGDVRKLMGRPEIQVLDVRRAAEYTSGHVPHALNIAHTRLLERVDEVPEDKELLVYCRTGSRSAVAAAMLERAGRRVRYVDDEFSNFESPA